MRNERPKLNLELKSNPLNRPFPDREFSRETVAGMLRVSLFVILALYFFRPLGMHVRGNHLLTCIGYGIVTFVVSTLYAYITERVVGWRRSGDGWTLGKWILDCGFLLFWISVGNFLYYNATVGWTAMAPVILLYISLPTVLVGLFPIAFSGMAIQLRAERNNQRAAGQLQLATARTASPHLTKELVSLGDGALSIDPRSLLFCESRQNYVRLVYLNDGQPAEQTIRTTLTAAQERLSPYGLLKCHRSYLVNPEFIRQARGNAQGLRLEMVATDEEIPVSRAYVETLRELVVG